MDLSRYLRTSFPNTSVRRKAAPERNCYNLKIIWFPTALTRIQ